jgi:hypothetical protein
LRRKEVRVENCGEADPRKCLWCASKRTPPLARRADREITPDLCNRNAKRNPVIALGVWFGRHTHLHLNVR